MSRMRAPIRDSGLSWMGVAIAVGGVALLAGVAGMFVWINDGSDYFDVAVALASAGFLTLVACVLSSVFGSSHGSQDDAFRRGRSMGYDDGFIEGRRTARPVVVPMLHAVGRDQEIPAVAPDDRIPAVARDQDLRGVARDRDLRAVARGQEIPASDTGVNDDERVDQVRFTPAILPVWRKQELELDQVVVWDRLVAWMGASRIPLLAGALSLVMVGVMVGVAMARPLVPVQALQRLAGSLLDQAVSSPGEISALLGRSADSRAAVADVANTSPLALPNAGPSPLERANAGLSPLAVTNAVLSPVLPIVLVNSSAVLASVPISPSGVAGLGEVTPDIPAVSPPVTAPPAVPVQSPEPVVAAPVATLTAAEQTAADALAAANLTAANAARDAEVTAAKAAAAAELTAANAARDAEVTAAKAAAAAALTAANAAAAATATAQAAEDAAWAVANP